MIPTIYSEQSRAEHLKQWGLDLADAALVFDGPCGTKTAFNGKFAYQLTVGVLRMRVAAVAWISDGNSRRVVSLRTEREPGLWDGDPEFDPPFGAQWWLPLRWCIGEKDVTRDAGYRELRKRLRPVRRRGKGKKPAKQRVTLRIPPDVVERWRATGKGWQSRMVALVSAQD